MSIAGETDISRLRETARRANGQFGRQERALAEVGFRSIPQGEALSNTEQHLVDLFGPVTHSIWQEEQEGLVFICARRFDHTVASYADITPTELVELEMSMSAAGGTFEEFASPGFEAHAGQLTWDMRQRSGPQLLNDYQRAEAAYQSTDNYEAWEDFLLSITPDVVTHLQAIDAEDPLVLDYDTAVDAYEEHGEDAYEDYEDSMTRISVEGMCRLAE